MIVRDWKQSVFEEYFTYYYITVLGIYACISDSGIFVSQIQIFKFERLMTD